jgi:hypothetical protein
VSERKLGFFVQALNMVFEFYFPVSREEVAAEGEEVPLEDYLGHGEKILVVDDE